jgi:hypothetical protein
MLIRSSKSLVFAALFTSLSVFACKSNDSASSNDDLDGVPEVAAVQMPLTGNAASEGTATEDDAIDPTTLTADELEQADVPATTDAGDLAQIREDVKRLNQSIRDFLGPVAAMVRNAEPSYHVGQVKMWGPVTRGATQYRFFLRETEAHQWGWRLDARLDGSGEKYSRVAAGELEVGTRARRGVGLMGFDLDALSAVDPTVTAQGQILIGFKHGELGTTVGYKVRDFTRDPAVTSGVDAILRAVHLKDGFNRVRLAYRGNVEGSATNAEELVLARLRHQRGLGGRSDLVVLQGDVPAGQALVMSQCWDQDLHSGFREVRSCPLDGLLGTSCVITQTTGDVNACPAPLRSAELPPADPNATMPDDSDPNSDVAAPAEIPSVEGDSMSAG